MKAILLLLVLISPLDAAFTYYRSITVNTGQVSSGAHTDFPMLVSGTYSYLAHTGSGGKVTSTSGYDIGFYSNSNCSTGKLAWETERYISSTGEVAYWVSVASLNDGSVIYMCYTDSGITTDQSNTNGTWNSGFKGVWHLPNGTTLTANDSTSGASNGTITNTTAGTGKIAGAANFGGASNDIINYSLPSALQITSAVTISAWVNITTSHTARFFGKNVAVNAPPYMDYGLVIDSSNNASFRASASGAYTATASYGISTSTWVLVAGTYDGTTLRLYTNGVERQTASASGAMGNNGGTVTLGGSAEGGSNGDYFAGLADEARISNTARSAGWLLTEYNNQSAPSSFYAVGSEVGGNTRIVRRVNNQ